MMSTVGVCTAPDDAAQGAHHLRLPPQHVGEARAPVDIDAAAVRLVGGQPGELADHAGVRRIVLVFEVVGDGGSDQVGPEGLLALRFAPAALDVGIAPGKREE
jgi:hypothetical protein